MKKVCAAVAAAAMGMWGGVQAQDFPQGYIGISYAQPEQNDRFFGDDRFDTGDVFFRLGGHLNEIFDTELRAGTTISTKTGSGREFGHDYIVSIMLRAGYDIGPVRPYAAVGLTYGKEWLELANGSKFRETFDDVSYAVGMDISLGKRIGVNAEYVQYYDIGNVTLKGPSFGAIWRF
ncbi:hypothetical protein S7S_00525 [Isoalcanivorax pacificus W11-5]|uniref:Outer membrane protein beta-barrel domain-containing protein n=1 Tax=Isoalcanivorax pacificus W11-5 TaxID=391936 RepID=A0A0B4XET9_9GAMM|nr:porin family protein [Isoalcanivorax pacificus]AJD46529.1 hypothetical protein S7S_00525 [Isoalcanivorax pacificus W11-5]